MPPKTPPFGAPPSRPTATVFQQSFPLVALLQLATFCAALGACVDGAKFGEQLDRVAEWSWEEWGAVSAAVVLGGVLGFFVGLGQQKMWRSALGGVAVGALCGVAILSVYVSPAQAIRALAAAAVLLLSTMIIRVRSA